MCRTLGCLSSQPGVECPCPPPAVVPVSCVLEELVAVLLLLKKASNAAMQGTARSAREGGLQSGDWLTFDRIQRSSKR